MSENNGRYPIRGMLVTAASAGIFWWYCWDRMPAAPSAPQSVSTADRQTDENGRPHPFAADASLDARLLPEGSSAR